MRSRGGYEKVPHQEDDSSRQQPNLSQYRKEDLRFEAMKTNIPWPGILLAIFLMLFGIMSFIFAWLHFTQELIGKEQAEIGFTIIGFLTFLPGFHHTRIAYYAMKGYRGYRFDDIPDVHWPWQKG